MKCLIPVSPGLFQAMPDFATVISKSMTEM